MNRLSLVASTLAVGPACARLLSFLVLASAVLVPSIVAAQDDDKGGDPPLPVLELTASGPTILDVGGTLNLTLVGHSGSGTPQDLTTASATLFESSKPTVVSVDQLGLATALAPGRAFVTAYFEGEPARLEFLVRDPADLDGDRLPDSWETANGLDPTDPLDAGFDPDLDGLDSTAEYALGTNPTAADTDGDRTDDGDEVVLGRDPLIAYRPQLNSDCVVAALNRSASVAEDGSWAIPNLPSALGPFRVRASCTTAAGTYFGQSGLLELPAGGSLNSVEIEFASVDLAPVRLLLTAPVEELLIAGETTQLTALAEDATGQEVDVSSAADGTNYVSSNSSIASVSVDGVVTALGSGTVLVSAEHEGAVAVLELLVRLGGDTDGDGMPDDWELANGFDPGNAADALGDADLDQLSNLEEFQLGTDPRNPDTDGDALPDGDEVNVHGTNPLLWDTDGDGVSDGLEVTAGSDPTDASDVSLNGILDSMSVSPSPAVIVVNEVFLEGSVQLAVSATLIDGTTLDATSSVYGTTYESNDLLIVNFGIDDGRLFGGDEGAAIVTVRNAGIAVEVAVVVDRFAPEPLAFLQTPGIPRLLGLVADHALIGLDADGATDDLLQVVDVSDPSLPVIVGSLEVNELADIAIDGLTAYLLTSFELLVVDLSVPSSPSVSGSVLLGPASSPGALELVDDTLYVSADSALRAFDVLDPATPVEVGQVALGGIHELALSGSWLVGLTADRLQVIDVTSPGNPLLVGETALRPGSSVASAADVAVELGRAFVADGGFETAIWGGVRTVDVGDPETPFVAGSTPDNLSIQVVAATEGLLFASGRQSTLRIYGTGSADPGLRFVLDLSGLGFGAGVARDLAAADGLAYLVGYRGGSTTGNGLYVSRYSMLEGDPGGPPTVEITSPEDGWSQLERRGFNIFAAAEDDRRVRSVEFYEGAELIGVDFEAPYLTWANGRPGAGVRTFHAVATDVTNQQGTSEQVSVTILENVEPEVRLLAPSSGTTPAEDSVIEIVASATDDGGDVPTVEYLVDGNVVGVDTIRPYRHFHQVPIGATQLSLSVRATDSLGQTSSDGPLVLQVADDASPEVGLIAPDDGEATIEGETLTILVGASDDVAVTQVEVFVDGVSQGVFDQAPFQTSLDIPIGASTLAIDARAEDSIGQTTDAPTHTVLVSPDPGTDVIGRVVDGAGVGLQGANVTCLGVGAVSDPGGSFLVSNVPTVPGLVSCTATWDSGVEVLSGSSASAIPEVLGTTDVGDIVVGSPVVLAGYGDSILAFVDETEGRLRVSRVFDDPGDLHGLVATLSGRLLGTRVLGQVSTLWSLDFVDGVGASVIGVVVDAATGVTVPIDDLAVDPTTGRLYGLDGYDEILYRIDEETASATAVLSFDEGARGIAFHPDGRFFVAGRFDFQYDEIREIDLATGSLVSTLEVTVPFAPIALDIRPSDGAFVFSDGFAQLLVIDPLTGGALAATYANGPEGVVVLPNFEPSLTTTVVGRAMRLPEEGGPAEPLEGATVVTGLQSAVTQADGTFSMVGVPATLGDLVAALEEHFVLSEPATPIPDGTTDVGDLVVDEGPSQATEPPSQ